MKVGGIDMYDMREEKGECVGRGCPPSHSKNKMYVRICAKREKKSQFLPLISLVIFAKRAGISFSNFTILRECTVYIIK